MDDSHCSANHLSITGEPIDLSLSNGFLGANGSLPLIAFPANLRLGNCSSISSYETLNAIGEGAYGIVSRARDKRNGSVVALKQIRILEYERSNGIPLTALREISILRSLRAQNVINLLEVAVDDSVLEDVYMVMEYCEQAEAFASLFAGFGKPPRQTPDPVQLEPRDIKMENLLLTGKGTLKIADFGMAREWASRPLTPGVATIWYRAPELLLGSSHYTSSVDLWSAGLLVGELLLQVPVLDGNDDLEQLSQIVKLLGSPTPEDIRALSSIGCPDLIQWQRESMPHGRADNLERRFLSRSSKGTVSFLSGLLKWDPNARWTASEALGKSRSRFASATEDWWRENPRAVDKELLPTFPVVQPDPDGDLVSQQDPKDDSRSNKRQKVYEDAPNEFGLIFDFGDAEPATKLPPRKRRR
ncbi:hypothetical protein GTA08_BOTSDO08774 [Botryosphaeria dothidea]|uniref:cyclin-dependent kinase n=1 Tax=Botryosphaeria dothidea TaxID=55169 RepID=A0A8H4IM21_9PEZI|nr:hypothetical protein GTA08_BOTSDO08774 [Botryosphaeria dothidea]